MRSALDHPDARGLASVVLALGHLIATNPALEDPYAQAGRIGDRISELYVRYRTLLSERIRDHEAVRAFLYEMA